MACQINFSNTKILFENKTKQQTVFYRVATALLFHHKVYIFKENKLQELQKQIKLAVYKNTVQYKLVAK